MRLALLIGVLLSLSACALPQTGGPWVSGHPAPGWTPQQVADLWGLPEHKTESDGVFGQSETWSWHWGLARMWCSFAPKDGKWSVIDWGRSKNGRIECR